MEPPVFETSKILGFPVSIVRSTAAEAEAPVDSSCYMERLHEWMTTRRGAHIITFNAEMAMLGQRNSEFARVLRAADMLVPDGAGIVLALKLRGISAQKCAGIELAEALLSAAACEQQSVFVIGGKPDVFDTAIQHWRDRLPALNVAGHHGYLNAETETAVLEQIQQQQPQLILVGMGVPRQEFWIRDRRHLAPHALWIGVGGSLDVWSGTKNRAPLWLRDHYLEWLYRLYQEPWRWRRMLALPHFAWEVLLRGDKS